MAQDLGALNMVRDSLMSKLMEYVENEQSETLHFEAWEEFLGHPEEEVPFSPDAPHLELFFPWFFFHFTMPEEEENEDAEPVTLAQLYLEKERANLSATEIEYIENALKTPFGFWSITKITKSKSIHLKNLHTLKEFEVMEKSGSEIAEIGDILFCKLVTMEGATLLEGCSNIIIPNDYSEEIEDINTFIKENHDEITEPILFDYDTVVIDLYLEIYKENTEEAKPKKKPEQHHQKKNKR